MSTIAVRLQETLAALDPADAKLLERLVSDALALVHVREGARNGAAVDANGWPKGYFEATSGAFANEPFDMPVDSPPEPNVAATAW